MSDIENRITVAGMTDELMKIAIGPKAIGTGLALVGGGVAAGTAGGLLYAKKKKDEAIRKAMKAGLGIAVAGGALAAGVAGGKKLKGKVERVRSRLRALESLAHFPPAYFQGLS